MKYDVIIIGSGPAGYIAAIRASQLGLKSAIVEKYDTMGGTCLNVGCIPSKALLDSSHHYYDALKHFEAHGILIDPPKIDFHRMIERKTRVVEQTTGGIKYLMEKNKVDVFEGLGSFVDATHIKVTKSDGSDQVIEGTHCIIATGSKPATLPFASIDKERIITSTEALKLPEIPKHMIVIGGGVIGLELGSVYNRLGAKVSVIEYMNQIVSEMDVDVSKELQKVLKKQGIKFFTSHAVNAVTRKGDEITVEATNKKGKVVEFKGDYCLVSVGRKAYTEGLGLENVGIQVNERGQIVTNDHLQTSIPSIYAIGDVIDGPMLAHKAEEEGIAVAEIIAGQSGHVNYDVIPGVIYTTPEVAYVGKTEEQLKVNKTNYKVGKFPFLANSRAKAINEPEGFVKILADTKTDKVLGVHIIGPHAGEMIAEMSVAMEFGASSEDIARTCHAHPTFSEAIKEAALSVDKRQIHS